MPQARRARRLRLSSYPTGLEGEEILADASRVVVRPIRVEDTALEQELVEGLSPETSWRRFQGALRTLSPTMLEKFTHVDYGRDMALVAMDSSSGHEREVAVCRYIRLPDGASCEFAIVLADDWQGRGLGPRLMARLIAIARSRGIATMIGWVLAENSGMLRMCSRLGFVEEPVPGDPQMRKVTLRL